MLPADASKGIRTLQKPLGLYKVGRDHLVYSRGEDWQSGLVADAGFSHIGVGVAMQVSLGPLPGLLCVLHWLPQDPRPVPQQLLGHQTHLSGLQMRRTHGMGDRRANRKDVS